MESWGPSQWGKRFTRSGEWALTLVDALLALHVDGRVHGARIDGSNPLRINHGVFWTDLSFPTSDGSVVRVDGIPNAHGQAIVAAISRVVAAQKDAQRRQLESERVRDRRKRLGDALHVISGWCQKMRQGARELDARERWMTLEQVRAWDAERTPLSMDEREVDACLADPNMRVWLGERVEGAQRDLALWRADLVRGARRRNERFSNEELVRRKPLFDAVEKQPLTDEQRRAVVCFDNRVLVVAAAGSGKTSIMVAKAVYAVEQNLVERERIVLLAFNDAAAKELAERAREALDRVGRCDTQIEAMTLHKLGLGIIGEATGAKPRVPSWLADNGIEKLGTLISELGRDNALFKRKWDLFRFVFGRDIPSFGAVADAEDWDRASGRTGFTALSGDVVKSLEELAIANWLFYNGVEFVYEGDYEHSTETARYSQYRPDFFYPAADLYHEHFALDKDGLAPPSFEGYLDGVKWKREIHRRYQTAFVETTSHDLWTGSAFKRLAAALRERGVVLKPDPNRPVKGKPPIEHEDLVRLVRAFLCHAKGNGLGASALRERLGRSPNGAFRYRHSLFLDLVEPIRALWDASLRAENAIDFEDMLTLAAEHVEAGRWASPYELVMVDEFQDASWARARLALSLVKAPGRHLFAVGDDWQSINRFAGADVSVMTGFTDWCGEGHVLRLEQTFRCPQALCDVSSKFVMKNPAQIEKAVHSDAPPMGPVLVAFQVQSRDEIRGAIDRYLSTLRENVVSGDVPRAAGRKLTVAILGRYRNDVQFAPTNWRARFGDVLDLRFSTVHSSKGTEADYVVVPGMEKKGFPSERVDDPVLGLAMPGCDNFPYAEERRLFYVALTRARRCVALVAVAGRTSVFLNELVEQRAVALVNAKGDVVSEVICPKCRNGVIVPKTGRFGDFRGCSNFPACRHTVQVGLPV